MLIYVHDRIPCLPREDKRPSTKGELEYCSTDIFLNYNYDQSVLIAGVYRPPDNDHPPYDAALANVLGKHKRDDVTTLMARDLNINSWGPDYTNWVGDNDLWILAVPLIPTYRTEAVGDAILLDVGAYLPDVTLLSEAETA